MNFIKERSAANWLISKIDPETSGKYVFDYMDYGDDHCQNCGQRIKWCVHIHDAEDESKQFVVGDDCIEFLLAMTNGLENPKELEQFREAKKEILKLFNWVRKLGVDTATMDGIVGFVNKNDPSGIQICELKYSDDGFARVVWGKYGAVYRPLSAPGINVEDWLRFFPNLKKILLSYESTSNHYRPVVSYSGYQQFADACKNGYYYGADGRLYDACAVALSGDSPGAEKKVNIDETLPKLGLGEVTAIKDVNRCIHVFLPDGRVLDTKKFFTPSYYKDLTDTNHGCVFVDSLEPMYPECTLDMDKFLTTDENLDKFISLCASPGEEIRAKIFADIEEAERKKREEEERKAREEEERKREEDRKANVRREFFNSTIADPTAVVDGLSGHCINSGWIDRFKDPLKKLVTDRLTTALEEKPDATNQTIKVNGCTSTFTLRYRDQIEQLKKMNEFGRANYLKNIVNKISLKYNRPTTWTVNSPTSTMVYKFVPTDIRELTTGDASVTGYTEITATPNTNPVPISESTKVTLTISQIRRLIKESGKIAFEGNTNMKRNIHGKTRRYVKEGSEEHYNWGELKRDLLDDVSEDTGNNDESYLAEATFETNLETINLLKSETDLEILDPEDGVWAIFPPKTLRGASGMDVANICADALGISVPEFIRYYEADVFEDRVEISCENEMWDD